MQLYILNEHGDVLGGTSIEDTLWRMTDTGFSNETAVRVILDVKGRPARYRYVSGIGRVIERGEIDVPNWSDDDPPRQVIFWPGTINCALDQVMVRGEGIDT
jgi:hypothetical protein